MAIWRKSVSFYGLAQSYLRGWSTGQRILVIESDDWGASRTPSREAFDRLCAMRLPMHRSDASFDCLESNEDLEMLYEVLEGFRDHSGRPPCITANMVMANPDFQRIRHSDYRQYAYEPVTATLQRFPGYDRVTELWQQGRERLLFVPQFHAREHLCWWRWMESLRREGSEAQRTFELGICGVPRAVSRTGETFYSGLYLTDDELARFGVDVNAMVADGARLFRETFGFNSLTTIAPNYCWTDTTEEAWRRAGLRYIQGCVFQLVGRRDRRRAHYMGQPNRAGGRYLIRNCNFEQNSRSGQRLGRCLAEIERAFWFRQPAVLCSHRVNYIGSIDPYNRWRGLQMLRQLLEEILHRWPDILFLSSPELAERMESDLEQT